MALFTVTLPWMAEDLLPTRTWSNDDDPRANTSPEGQTKETECHTNCVIPS